LFFTKNDLPESFASNFKATLFADDLKSFNTIDYRLNPSVTQCAIDILCEWSKNWQFDLSISKCSSLLLSLNFKFVDVNLVKIGNDVLPALDSVNALGAIVDCPLTFADQMSSIISKAKQRIFLLFKSFKSRDVLLFLFAYKTYILPLLDYCSVIWNPYKLYDIDRIENVQRYFTKRLDGMCSLNYQDRLIQCSLTSLELRRLIEDLIMCFKIVHGLIFLNFNNYFISDNASKTRSHNFKIRLILLSVMVVNIFFSQSDSCLELITLRSCKFNRCTEV